MTMESLSFEWRCISYWTCEFSNVSHVSFPGCRFVSQFFFFFTDSNNRVPSSPCCDLDNCFFYIFPTTEEANPRSFSSVFFYMVDVEGTSRGGFCRVFKFEIMEPTPKKTWVSNNSRFATYWKGSVGIRSHLIFDGFYMFGWWLVRNF